MNPVGWFEIYVQDMQRARTFYEGVLEVKLSPLETPLEMLGFPMTQGAPGAGGALVRMDGVASGGSTLVYFVTDECGAAGERVVAQGGSIHKPKMSIGPYGYVVLAVDTEGNMIGLHSMR